ncbi:hypothetical protein [Shimia sp. SDUM112013]|uniref:hypothetical protein n=1 Tax=Shimia sp. SDUM112013 TaxID=3136160 RepID=UPI0032F08205
MRKTILLLLVSATALSACQSRYNPFNWFGNGEEVVVDPNAEPPNPLLPERSALARPEEAYPGVPVTRIDELKIERVADGAIIRATGTADRHGVFDLKLRPLNDGEPVDGVLTYEFLGVHPKYPPGVGSEASRRVIVAHALTDQQLQGVRTIRVQAFQNAMQARR